MLTDQSTLKDDGLLPLRQKLLALKKSGFSYGELSIACGRKENYWSGVVNGKGCSAESVAKLSSVTGLSCDFLLKPSISADGVSNFTGSITDVIAEKVKERAAEYAPTYFNLLNWLKSVNFELPDSSDYLARVEIFAVPNPKDPFPRAKLVGIKSTAAVELGLDTPVKLQALIDASPREHMRQVAEAHLRAFERGSDVSDQVSDFNLGGGRALRAYHERILFRITYEGEPAILKHSCVKSREIVHHAKESSLVHEAEPILSGVS